MGRWHATHDALRRAAFELFAERGYDATATAHIAERAGVSEMTLFRHFPTKEALLLSDPFDPIMADAVRARPDADGPMMALAEGIREAWRSVDAERAEQLRALLRIVAGTPSLRGAIERTSGETAEALEAALTARGVAPAEARIAVAAVIAGLSAALLQWARSEAEPLDAAVGSALDVLGGA